MNVLLVLAHPEPRSFNGALRGAALAALQAAGHRVEQSDLCAMGWQPVLGPAAAHRDETGRRALLDQWTQRLARVEHETPQPFRHLADFPSPSMRDHR